MYFRSVNISELVELRNFSTVRAVEDFFIDYGVDEDRFAIARVEFSDSQERNSYVWLFIYPTDLTEQQAADLADEILAYQ